MREDMGILPLSCWVYFIRGTIKRYRLFECGHGIYRFGMFLYIDVCNGGDWWLALAARSLLR